MPIHQPDSEFRLQPTQLPGERLLLHAEAFGSPRDVAFPGRRDESPETVKLNQRNT